MKSKQADLRKEKEQKRKTRRCREETTRGKEPQNSMIKHACKHTDVASFGNFMKGHLSEHDIKKYGEADVSTGDQEVMPQMYAGCFLGREERSQK